MIDKKTGEQVELENVEGLGLSEATYTGMSTKPVTAEQAKALLLPPADDEIDVKPDSFGAVYMSHAGYRKRLNAAFGPAGWALRRLSDIVANESTEALYQEWALYAEGRFIASAVGEHSFSSDMSYGDASESIKSNALMRCCKDLGMAMDLWDRRFADAWRNRMCVKVLVKRGDRTKPAWRRLDSPPIYGESIANDSPNQEAYRKGAKATPKAEAKSDDVPETQREARKPAVKGRGKPPSRKAEPERGESSSNLITDSQRGLLWARMKDAQVDVNEFKEHLRETYGFASSNEITKDRFEEILADIKAIKDAG